MSAFIAGDETINKALSFIKSDCKRNSHIYRPLENKGLGWKDGGHHRDAACALGNEMRNLNIQAVCARYEGEVLETLLANDDYQYVDTLRPDRIQAFKSLRCWLYQCSEGDIPETELFKAFDEVSKNMALHIVNRTPEFDAAVWG